MTNRRFIIVPNTELLVNAHIYTKELEKEESHALAVIKFSEIYNLGITYESIGLPRLDLCSEKWYHEIAKMGHIFLRLEDALSIIYLPEEISLNQKEWFKAMEETLRNVVSNLGIQVLDKSGNKLISQSPTYSSKGNAYVFELLYKIIDEQTRDNKDTKIRR